MYVYSCPYLYTYKYTHIDTKTFTHPGQTIMFLCVALCAGRRGSGAVKEEWWSWWTKGIGRVYGCVFRATATDVAASFISLQPHVPIVAIV